MSDEKVNVLDQALADILLQASESMGKATEFALAEMPDIVQQALLWYGVYNLIICVAGIITGIIYYLCLRTVLRDFENQGTTIGKLHCYTEGIYFIPVGVAATVASFTILMETINLVWLKIWIAPKVWMIEYAASMVK